MRLFGQPDVSQNAAWSNQRVPGSSLAACARACAMGASNALLWRPCSWWLAGRLEVALLLLQLEDVCPLFLSSQVGRVSGALMLQSCS